MGLTSPKDDCPSKYVCVLLSDVDCLSLTLLAVVLGRKLTPPLELMPASKLLLVEYAPGIVAVGGGVARPPEKESKRPKLVLDVCSGGTCGGPWCWCWW